MSKPAYGYCNSCKRYELLQKCTIAILATTRFYCESCMPQPRERIEDASDNMHRIEFKIKHHMEGN